MSAIEEFSAGRSPIVPFKASVPRNDGHKPNRLVDRFGRAHTYLRISVTDRCNLRCSYCMPPEGIDWKQRDELLSFEEILRVTRVLVDMGIDKIRITGGEPLARRNLDVLIEQLAGLEGLKTIAMTTNGILLNGQTARLREAGLNALNISLDTLQPDRFMQIAKRDYFDAAMSGIAEALATGFDSLKLNVVVMAGVNEDEILDFVDFVKDKPMNLRFIEYMPFKSNSWSQAAVFPFATMKQTIESRYRLILIAPEFGAVAKDFALEDYSGQGYPGTVSFITSMTDSFCGACNRLRLTADGQIKSCLFHPAEVGIRDSLRRGVDDAELERLVASAVLQKQEAHPPMEELLQVENRAMIEIGG
jgi:cyclic pyranopterin phosphate synthase